MAFTLTLWGRLVLSVKGSEFSDRLFRFEWGLGILGMMRVERLSRDWDVLAQQDALFVVLAEPGKEG